MELEELVAQLDDESMEFVVNGPEGHSGGLIWRVSYYGLIRTTTRGRSKYQKDPRCFHIGTL